MTKILIDEALRLADAIELGWLENVDADKADIDMIQTELRRLYAENQALRHALEKSEATMKQALEALEFFKELSLSMREIERAEESITALRQALEQPDRQALQAAGIHPAPCADIKTHLANDLEQSAAMLDSREFDAVQLDNCASMMRYAATVIRQALEQPAQRDSSWCMKMNGCKAKCEDCPDEVPEQPAPAQEPDPDELTIAYMSGLYDGKKRKPWVGLTDEDKAEIVDATERDERGYVMALVEAKLKEKNT